MYVIGNVEHRAMTCWLTMKWAKREKWFSILLNTKAKTSAYRLHKAPYIHKKKNIKFSLHIGDTLHKSPLWVEVIEKKVLQRMGWKKKIHSHHFCCCTLLNAATRIWLSTKSIHAIHFCLHWAQQTFTDYPLVQVCLMFK